ncbi:hypothetical protein Tco_0110759 [Tanacetum coccineum]
MDNPNITMEEYIRVEEEKARRCGKVYNWETATYGKIWYDEDVHDLRSVENEFPAIVFNDELSSEKTLSCEPTVSSLNNNEIKYRISFDESDDEDYTISIRHMALLPRDQRHQYLSFEGLQYINADIADFETTLADRLSDRMLMEHMDAQGQGVFISQAWRRIFDIQGPLVHELILEFFSTFRFGDAVVNLDKAKALQFQLGGAGTAESGRQISDKGDLSAYWREISSKGDLLGTPPSYTLIRDPMMRLCHRLIACSIAGRSQAPKKGAMIPGGQFVARLAQHFGLLTKERLQGLTVIAWVALRPERQPDAAAGAPKADEDAPAVDEGAPANPARMHAPQLPHAAPKTMP